VEQRITPSQTVGPFFSIGLTWLDGPFVVPDGTPDAVWLRGTVTDGAGEPVPDALVETWQAGRDGRFDHPDDPSGSAPPASAFRGFGRCPTDEAGRYAILTVKPGPVPGPDGVAQAPHVDLSVFARGLLKRVVTRAYFGDEGRSNASDPMLASLTDPYARATLIAERSEDGYRFDVRLQGDRETVFFDV
jgi:protocatechuate 3,4-dioxygenase alpha subunit